MSTHENSAKQPAKPAELAPYDLNSTELSSSTSGYSPAASATADSENTELARRVWGVARKPLSTPAYAGLVAVVALTLGFGAYGIVHGVNALETQKGDTHAVEPANPVKPADVVESNGGVPDVGPAPIDPLKVVEQEPPAAADAKVTPFGEPDANGIMHATAILPQAKRNATTLTLDFPAATLEKNYALHIYASGEALTDDAQCSFRFNSPKIDQSSGLYEKDHALDFANICPTGEDGSIDIWLPVARTNWLYDIRFSLVKIKGWGATLNLDLMELANASPLDWDGTAPLEKTGPAFIRTTSGAWTFNFSSPEKYTGTAYVSQKLNVFEDMVLRIDPNDKDHVGKFLRYTDAAGEPVPGYIFIIPDRSSMNTPWILTELRGDDFPATQ